MKKLLIALAIIFFAAPVMAQTCHVGVAWTPDPAQSAVVSQFVYHDTDGVDGGDVLVGTVAKDASQHQWVVASACYPSDRVYVITSYIGGITKESPKIQFVTVVGAVLSIAVKDD